MKIPRWDWDKQAFIEDEYPDSLFQEFLTWLLTTKAWLEYPDLVNKRVLNLQRRMADLRQGVPSHHEADAPIPIDRAAQLKARRQANLAKAREAKRLKKEAVHAEA